MSLSVVLAGGGSAGHVSPMLAIADALTARVPDVRITCLGTAEGLEARLVPARGYELRTLAKVPLPRKPTADLLRVPGRLRGAVKAAEQVLAETDADVVVGMGGYVATPAYLAARNRRVPIVVHEQNTRPGLANRVGARFSTHVATTFTATRLPHAVRVGMPLRREISTLDRAAVRAEARTHFGLGADGPTLLVTGGSLGAQRINEAMTAGGGALLEAGVSVLHLTGTGKAIPPPQPSGAGASGSQPGRYVVVEYTDRMDLAYAAADLVLCRAGANTVCELTTVGLPAVYVPLPIGNGEQRLNAEPVVAAGGGLLVDNARLDGDYVAGPVRELLLDPERLMTMATAAASHGSADADEKVVDMILTAARQSPEASGQ